MTNSNSSADKWHSDNHQGSRIAALAQSFALEQFNDADQHILAFLGASVLAGFVGVNGACRPMGRQAA